MTDVRTADLFIFCCMQWWATVAITLHNGQDNIPLRSSRLDSLDGVDFSVFLTTQNTSRFPKRVYSNSCDIKSGQVGKFGWF